MAIVLRSISLLEGKFTQEAYVKTAAAEKVNKPNKRILKQRVGYMDEGVSSTRTKLAQMKITEVDEGRVVDQEDEDEGTSKLVKTVR